MTKAKASNPKDISAATDEPKMTEVTTKKRGLILSASSADGQSPVINLNVDLVKRAFGSDDSGFCEGLFNQVVQMTAENGKINVPVLEFVGGALTEISPRNGTEGILAAQIVANHVLAMKLARMMVAADTIEKMQKLETMATKMMRTTTAQMEALHKMRHGGKQKVKVEHVHVHEGGQAIVGDVTTGGR